MSKNIRTEEVDHLFDAILCLKDKEEQMYEQFAQIGEGNIQKEIKLLKSYRYGR